MPWQNQPDDKDRKGARGPGGRNPWGGSGGGGGEPPPDLDEMLRRAKDNLRQVMPGGFRSGRMLVLGLLAGAALWLASGLYIIVPGEYGVIQRFGSWTGTKSEAGLGYRLPWPVESLTKLNVSEVRRMEIGFVDRYGRAAALQKQDIPEESLMLTSDANIVNLDVVVLWNIKSAEDYLFNIRDPENTIKKVAESAIREAVGQTPMFDIITKARDDVAHRARDIMIQNLDSYKAGINISQVLIQEAEVHPDVQDAFQDVQSAKQDAFDVQNRASAYREDILPKARGRAIQMKQEAAAYKQTAIARATGDTGRFRAIYEAYLTGPEVTKTRLYIETMEDVLKVAQKIIIDEKGATSGGVLPYLPLGDLKPAPAAVKSSVVPLGAGSADTGTLPAR